MAWTGTVISTKRNADGLTFTLAYEITDGTETKPFTEGRVSIPAGDDQ